MKINDIVFCINESVYSSHISKGDEYMVSEISENQNNIRIKNNQQKLVWLPLHCFDHISPPKIKAIFIDDKIINNENDCIEVTIELSDQTRFYTRFITNNYIEYLLKSNSFLVISKFIIVNELNEKDIHETIYELYRKNELIEVCSQY